MLDSKDWAYERVVKTGKARNIRERILLLIKEKPITTIQLVNDLDLSMQTVSARLNELEKMGYIYKTPSDDGRYSLWTFEHNRERQMTRRQMYENKAYHRWLKKGLSRGWISRVMTDN